MDINQILPGGLAVPPREYSPLVLAYIGDSVYETYVRTRLVARANTQVNNLHKTTINYVKAKAQSDIMKALLGQLTEEEEWVFKRGRNAKSATVPKDADVGEYRYATGFEALIGYLYLSGNIDRLYELLQFAFNYADKS